ncbi:glycosyltransferase [Herminiimonas fonticola]|uniref:Glycosyltransferase involved in cell wall biosynthesis n=1 Tax=Herminiimonas fonticola TaxID=303380 RepID=A0A4R6GGW2_9BURK|nr:glycosyltransferase [Herminiimonas fonticola]RBA24423.1 Glycosyl transferases group 1 [Herminiimonas fonticola]TDN93540.1 glycosyltransferase involved in cell wall biosynthesis [Herminiimonas fonticola]
MHILIVNHSPIPVFAYGGTERVIWDLGRALVRAGHRVSYLVPEGSHCDFAEVLLLQRDIPWEAQVPAGVDITHFQFNPNVPLNFPHVVTQHGNSSESVPLPRNTVFVSKNHAQRHGSDAFVYNGLDWSAYGAVNWQATRTHAHFLGKAAWRVKNVQGAIDVARAAHIPLDVLGGNRINLKRGFRFTWSRQVKFHGMVGGDKKFQLLNTSRGLVFPTLWHEPFGLAVIESLYFGAPVFATPYGALPEIVTPECGILSTSRATLAQAVSRSKFDPHACHARALTFNSDQMANDYLSIYTRVLAGESLNPVSPVLHGDIKHLPWTA